MKNYWKELNERLTKEELNKRPSLFRIVYLLVPVLIYYIVADVTEVILWFLINFLYRGATDETIARVSAYSYTIKGLIYSVGIVVSIIFLRRMVLNEIEYQDEAKEAKKLNFVKILAIVVLSALTSYALNVVFNYTGFTGSSSSFQSVHDAQFSLDLVSSFVLYGLLSPVMEEIIFRGILYNRMKRVFPIAVSIIVSSFLFGVYHANLVQGVYGTIMGLIIVMVYERMNSFVSAVIFHSVANITVLVLNYTIWK